MKDINILETLLNSQSNLDNLCRLVPGVDINPYYIIAKKQLDDAIAIMSWEKREGVEGEP